MRGDPQGLAAIVFRSSKEALVLRQVGGSDVVVGKGRMGCLAFRSCHGSQQVEIVSRGLKGKEEAQNIVMTPSKLL